MKEDNIIKGQGAQRNVNNRFDRYTFEPEDEDFDTIGGLVSHVFERIPEVGESNESYGYLFTILKKTEQNRLFCFILSAERLRTREKKCYVSHKNI